MQNVSEALRPLIVAEPGFLFCSLDLSRCEVTLAAAMSGDADLIADLNAGDPYIELAVDFYGEEARDDAHARMKFKRALIAALRCAALYGQGSSSLAADLGITKSESEALRAKLRAAYPTVFAWIKMNTTAAKRGERWFTITGRPLPLSEPGREFTATNHQVQGSGADMLYDGVERLAAVIGRRALVLSVHDEIVAQVRPHQIEATLEALVTCMTTELPGITLTGEAKYLGTSWSK